MDKQEWYMSISLDNIITHNKNHNKFQKQKQNLKTSRNEKKWNISENRSYKTRNKTKKLENVWDIADGMIAFVHHFNRKMFGMSDTG